MADSNDPKSKSLLNRTGPVHFGSSPKGESHLGISSGSPGYTSGMPYDSNKYVTGVIGDNNPMATEVPSSVRSSIQMPHLGVVEPPQPAAQPSPYPQPMTLSPTYPQQATFKGRYIPNISPSAKLDSAADIRGNVIISEKVHIAAGTIISAHEDEPIFLGPGCAIFEGAVLTILPVRVEGARVSARLVKVEGQEYPLYLGEDTVVAPRAQITGPCYIGRNCFVGAGSHIFWAKIGDGVIIEPGAFIMNVEIPAGVFVPSGLRVTVKENISKLPKITDRYRFIKLGKEMLDEIRSRF